MYSLSAMVIQPGLKQQAESLGHEVSDARCLCGAILHCHCFLDQQQLSGSGTCGCVLPLPEIRDVRIPIATSLDIMRVYEMSVRIHSKTHSKHTARISTED